MDPEKTPENGPPQQPPAYGPQPTVRYYANSLQVNGGPIDLSIDFGFQVINSPPEWGVRVTLSWEAAHLLARYLANAEKEYAETIGPIRDVQPEQAPEGVDQP